MSFSPLAHPSSYFMTWSLIYLHNFGNVYNLYYLGLSCADLGLIFSYNDRALG